MRVLIGIFTFLVLFCLWWSVASDYDYGALAGTYVFHSKEETCSLYLHSDGTFDQELRRGDQIQKSQGSWHRSGQAGVSFSNEFLRIPREELDGSGKAYGWFHRVLGLFPMLDLAPSPGGPEFHKSLFH